MEVSHEEDLRKHSHRRSAARIDCGDFDQRVVLCHRGFDRPTVFVTEGYNGRYALYSNYIEELAKLFDTNIILAEYQVI